MAYTWMIDPTNGATTNGGDSWTVDFTNTDGVANGTTTFTSATGGFTGKENRWMYIDGKNARRRITAVGSDTSVTLSTSVSAGTGLTFRVGGPLIHGNNVSDMAAGDTLRVAKSTDAASIGTVTYTKGSAHLTLPSALSPELESGQFAWVPSANVTSTTVTARVGNVTKSASNTIASGFTTGVAAYQRLHTFFAGGTATASSTNSTYAAGNAVDQSDATYWRCNNELPCWWKYDFGSGVTKTITAYAIYGSSNTEDPYDWIFQGSNNDSDWTDLHTANDQTLTDARFNWFTIDSPSSYRYYRVYISDNETTGNYCRLMQVVYTEGAVDLSSYQQLSLWIYASGTVSANVLRINLCSDTVGATAVDTINVTTPIAASTWQAIVLNKGSALGSSIQSISIEALSDPGALTLYTGNIIACAANGTNCVTHHTIIGKNTGDSDFWYAPSSIRGTQFTLLDNSVAGAIATTYQQANGSATFYGIQCQPHYYQNANYFLNPPAGSAGNVITTSGGWSPASGTQTGTSMIYCNTSRGFYGSDYNDTEKIGFVNTSYAVFGSAMDHCTLEIEHLIGATAGGFYFQANSTLLTCTYKTMNQCDVGIYLTGVYDIDISGGPIAVRTTTGDYNIQLSSNVYDCEITATDLYAGAYTVYTTTNCARNRIYFEDIIDYGTYAIYATSVGEHEFTQLNSGTITGGGGNYTFGLTSTFGCVYNNMNLTAGVSGAYAIWVLGACDVTFNNFTSSGHATALIGYGTEPFMCRIFINGYVGTEALVTGSKLDFASAKTDGIIACDRYNSSLTDYRRHVYGCLMQSETSVRHTAADLAWKFTIQDADVATSLSCARFKIAELYLAADTTHTITLYARRHQTTMGISLVCPRDQLPGLTTDVTDSISGDIDTWDQLSIELTPTEAGVVKLYVHVYGANNDYGYIDDLDVSTV